MKVHAGCISCCHSTNSFWAVCNRQYFPGVRKPTFNNTLSCSFCHQAQDQVSGAIVALKVYHMSKLNNISSHQVAREVRLHAAMEHENIIALHAAFQEAGSVVLVQVSLPSYTFVQALQPFMLHAISVPAVTNSCCQYLLVLGALGMLSNFSGMWSEGSLGWRAAAAEGHVCSCGKQMSLQLLLSNVLCRSLPLVATCGHSWIPTVAG